MVDPLFRKTCQDFDEGGAKSLLLNALAVGSRGQVVFDATDAPFDDSETLRGDRRPPAARDGDAMDVDREGGEDDEFVEIGGFACAFSTSFA